MEKIWVGDFRGKQLQKYFANFNLEDSSNLVVADDAADLLWFEAVTNTIQTNTKSNSSIIIMLGLNDCINSCTWAGSIDIEKRAEDYADHINNLMATHKFTKFYFCSVNPVSSAIPGSNFYGDLIDAETLNKAIEKFNSKIADTCKATFINSWEYFNATSFHTRDGVRYAQPTCINLLTFILNELELNLGFNSNNNFVPRLSQPAFAKHDGDGDSVGSYDYWLHTSYGGLNPFPIRNLGGPGDTLPNCTAWAYGRFYELLGSEPKLSWNNAEFWYPNTSDGYERGQEPRLGAVICWRLGAVGDDPNVEGSDAGHVGIVEQINYAEDGTVLSITTSESSYSGAAGGTYDWRLKDRYPSSPNWNGGSYIFQGFIYLPTIAHIENSGDTNTRAAVVRPEDRPEGTNSSKVTKDQVCTDDRPLTDDEKKINARYIYQYLSKRGWSLNAIAGMLGNMECESWLSPGAGERGHSQSGFGLVQWTPKSNLTNWTRARNYADDDIDGQLERIIYEKDNGKQYFKNKYKYTFKEFSISTDSPYTLACAFAYDYERSGVSIWGFHMKECNSCRSGNPKNSTVECRKCYTLIHGEAAAEKQGNENRVNLVEKPRGNAAVKWFEFLGGTYNGNYTDNNGNTNTTVKVDAAIIHGLNIDKLSSDSVKASVILKNCHKYSYWLNELSGIAVKTKTLIENPTYSTGVADKRFITIENKEKLIPNTEYELQVDFVDKNGDKVDSQTITFTTLQDFPESVQTVALTHKDKKYFKPIFELATTPSTIDFGYWKDHGDYKNQYGYVVKLIVNGQVKEIKYLDRLPMTLNINENFSNKVKPADIVQIGINTWVTYESEKLFDSDVAVVSNPICLISQPFLIHLNTED